jgi:UDP-3-O-[3-hydroxymyristoyl] glucosamine N-acyltransferase
VTLQELTSRLGCRLEGDGRLEVVRVAGLEQAGPGDLTFLANPKYAAALPTTKATAVIVADGVAGAPCAVLRAPNPYLAFARAAQALLPDTRPAPGVDPLATVAPDATLGDGVAVGAFAVVGAGARIGARTILHPHVVIGPGAEIGPDCLCTRTSQYENVAASARASSCRTAPWWGATGSGSRSTTMARTRRSRRRRSW